MHDDTLILETLSQDAHLSLNKKLLKILGINTTLILSDLISKYKYFKLKNELDEEMFFYNSMHNIMKDTTLTPKQQRKAIEILEEKKILETKLNRKNKKTYPTKHFKINFNRLEEILKSSDKIVHTMCPNVTYECDQKTHTNVTKGQCNKNNINKNNINKSFNKLKDNRFEKPVNFDNSPNNKNNKNKHPKINEFTIKIITLWNKCPSVPTKHKIDKYYKFHSKVQKYINALKAGMFGEIIDLSRDYMYKNAIMEKDLTKKYTEAEIKKIVSNCLLAYKEGYWPTNKNILPKSISELFYSTPFYSTKYVPGESKSHFLYIHARPPRKIRKSKSSEIVKREMEARKCILTEEEEKILDKQLSRQIEERMFRRQIAAGTYIPMEDVK
jgi:hypothetical protein